MHNKLTAAQTRDKQRNVRLARYNKFRLQLQALPVAIVPDALPPDNLLPVDVLENGMTVNIPQWNRVLPEDRLEVLWDDNIVNTHTVDTPEDETWPYSFKVPSTELITEGLHSLAYKVTAASGAATDSDKLTVKIDREAPDHDNVPPSLVFPAEVNTNGITLEYLDSNNNAVIATVPGYDGMEADQKVHPHWSTVTLDTVTVTEADVTAGEIKVTFPGDIIRREGEGKKPAHYYLTSRAGFDGKSSEFTMVNVLLTPRPDSLQAPRVPLADNGLIDLEDANAGVTIEIDSYTNARTGDIIVAQWGSRTLSTVAVIEGKFPVEVPVSRSTVIGEGSGTVKVSYQVARSDLFFPAPPTEVEVDVDTVGPVNPDPDSPINKNLAPPIITGNSGKTNELTPEDYNHPATITIPVYENAKAGEIVTAYWGASTVSATLRPYTVTTDDLSQNNFPGIEVPKAVVNSSSNDKTWPVYYTLSRPQPPANPVFSPSAMVNIHMVGPGGLDGLDAAEFTDASESGWLLLAQVENGLRVHVAVYENMLDKDEIVMNWQAFSTTNAAAGTEITDSNYRERKIVGAPERANGVDFVIPYKDKVDAIAGASASGQGAGQIIYTVTQAGSDYNAPAATVKIDLGAP